MANHKISSSDGVSSCSSCSVSPVIVIVIVIVIVSIPHVHPHAHPHAHPHHPHHSHHHHHFSLRPHDPQADSCSFSPSSSASFSSSSLSSPSSPKSSETISVIKRWLSCSWDSLLCPSKCGLLFFPDIYIYIPGSSLSTFFLLIAVFAWIYTRSDFLCPLELENAHLFLDGRAFTFFPRVFTLISWENTLIFLASKCTKCKNAKSGAITLMWRKTAQKNRNLANKHLFVFSRIQDLIYIHT